MPHIEIVRAGRVWVDKDSWDELQAQLAAAHTRIEELNDHQLLHDRVFARQKLLIEASQRRAARYHESLEWAMRHVPSRGATVLYHDCYLKALQALQPDADGG